MTDPNTPNPDAQPPVDPPAYTAPAADPTYAAPAEQPAYAPPAAPTYGENAPAYAAPSYEAAPAYNAAPGYPGYPGGAAPATPGRTMGIVALVLAILPGLNLVGLILGIVALVQSRKVGQKNGIALAAIIVSAVLIVIGIIAAIAFFAWVAGQGNDLLEQVARCEQDPSASIIFNGLTIPCQEFLDQNNR